MKNNAIVHFILKKKIFESFLYYIIFANIIQKTLVNMIIYLRMYNCFFSKHPLPYFRSEKSSEEGRRKKYQNKEESVTEQAPPLYVEE